MRKYTPSMIRTRRQRILRGVETVEHIPNGTENATVIAYRENEVIFDGSCSLQCDRQPVLFEYFTAYLEHQNDATKRILERVSFPDDGIHISNAIRNGNALGVAYASDESSTNMGAAAWTIVGGVDDIYCEGRIGQPKTTYETDPYRAESLGIILSMLTAIEHLCIYHKITEGQVTIACDNDASLENSIDRNSRMKIKNDYFDVFWAI